MQQINASLKEARNAIKFAKPHGKCEYSECGDKCPVCSGDGWITKALSDRIPEDKRTK